jgi:hypothetical protein
MVLHATGQVSGSVSESVSAFCSIDSDTDLDDLIFKAEKQLELIVLCGINLNHIKATERTKI